MAVMTRRLWSAIQTETIRRLAGINYTGFDTRVQYWLWSSYLTLCTTYHHFELDKEDTSLTLSSGAYTLALPADCFEVIALTLRDSTGAQAGEVQQYEFGATRGAYTAESGLPTRRARFAGTLYFDKKADANYSVDLYYYRLPTAPDFASGSATPETGVDCDEYIIAGACALANPAIGRPDLGTIDRQVLTDWLASQVRPPLIAEGLEDRERAGAGRTLGGKQG